MWADEDFYRLVKRKKKELGVPMSDREVTKMIASDYLSFEKWLKSKRKKGRWD